MKGFPQNIFGVLMGRHVSGIENTLQQAGRSKLFRQDFVAQDHAHRNLRFLKGQRPRQSAPPTQDTDILRKWMCFGHKKLPG
tara:strand:+ start:329 stop:574 length:246 start_codon:yes stop_codon:yes gene_type:complete